MRANILLIFLPSPGDLRRVDNKNQGIGGFVLAERASSRHAQNTQYQIR